MIAHLHMLPRLEQYVTAHLHMFSKLELQRIAHLHVFAQSEQWELYELPQLICPPDELQELHELDIFLRFEL